MIAVQGAELLRRLDIDTLPLLLVFIVTTSLINLIMGSASAKWALMAPVFVRMFYLPGITPEATQMAYRIGDPVTNVVTPLIPYLALVVAIVQRYDSRFGIGSMIAAMVPYSIALLLVWSGLLAFWVLFDLPLGPGAPIMLPG